jgi:hypothetical protein
MIRSPVRFLGAWIIAMACAGPARAADDTTDPSALVARLGAARYADRESAAAALEKLGRAALPALKQGRKASDPEVQARAGILYRGIERSVLLGPTTVSIEPGTYKLGPLLDVIARQADVPIARPNLDLDRAITITEPPPRTLWQALDLVTKTVPVEAEARPIDRGNDGVGIALEPRADAAEEAPAPILDGPLRVRLLELDDRRVKRFADDVGRSHGPLGLSASLTGRLQVTAEPRLIFGHAGPVTILEARDESGRDLTLEPTPSTPTPTPTPGVDRPIPSDVEFTDGPSLLEPFTLAHPGTKLGRTLAILRGSVPIALACRQLEGASLPLTPGATAETDRVKLSFVGIEPRQGSKRFKAEVVLRPVAGVALDPFLADQADAVRLVNHQIDVVDPLGRPWHVNHIGSEVVGSELRLRLLLSPLQTESTPARLLYHDLITTARDIPFTFKNIPLP